MTTRKTSGNGLPSTTAVDFEVKPPFRILDDNRRRFIRIDIDEPIRFNIIKSGDGTFWPQGSGPTGTGEILNISAGGFLMYCNEPILENSVLSMSLKIEGCDVIENILGVAKRIEIDSGGYLVGLESIPREKLNDIMTSQEISDLPTNVSSFTERLQSLLNQFIFSRKLENELSDV